MFVLILVRALVRDGVRPPAPVLAGVLVVAVVVVGDGVAVAGTVGAYVVVVVVAVVVVDVADAGVAAVGGPRALGFYLHTSNVFHWQAGFQKAPRRSHEHPSLTQAFP